MSYDPELKRELGEQKEEISRLTKNIQQLVSAQQETAKRVESLQALVKELLEMKS